MGIRHLCKKNEAICSHEDSYVNFYSSIIYSGPKLETIQMCINKWIDKWMWYNKILFCIKKEWLVMNATIWINFENIMLSQGQQCFLRRWDNKCSGPYGLCPHSAKAAIDNI